MTELSEELQGLIDKLNEGLEQTTKELGRKSLDYMKREYMENNMGSHTSNLNLHAYKRRYKNGFIISSGDDIVAVFNEFGTGIVGEGTGILADTTGYQYNVSSPYKGVIPEGAIAELGREYCESVNTPNTWWYWQPRAKQHWKHTEGMKGKNMFYGLVDELQELAPREFKIKVGQIIGNYGGKK